MDGQPVMNGLGARERAVGPARGCLVSLVLLLALGVAVPTDATARPKTERPVLSPNPGENYGAHPVRLRVKAHRHDKVVVRLNGVVTTHEVARSHDGMRKLQLSPNHGLRHGRNVLRVRVNRFHGGTKNRKIGFRVSRNRPLAAAGRDQSIAPGARTRLSGTASRPNPRAASGRLRYHWKVVSAPDGSRLARGTRGGKGGLLGLRSRRSSRPGFRADVPGEYEIRLAVTGGGKKGVDKVTYTVDPPPLLRVDTMAQDSDGTWGIKVGQTVHHVTPGSWLQVLILDLKLGTVKLNKAYSCPNYFTQWPNCVGAVRKDIKDAGPNSLVIAANQPDSGGTDQAPHGAWEALHAIGITEQSALEPAANDLVRGTFSAIGPIGGPATAHTAAANTAGAGAIEGVLIRNSRLQYSYSSPEHLTFDTQAPGSTASQNVIRVGETEYTENVGSAPGGFHVVVVDKQTLAGTSHWFATGGAKGQAALNVMNAMRDVLADANGGHRKKLVFVATRGKPTLDQHAYEGLAPSHPLYHAVRDTASGIMYLGGTRTGFFQLIDHDLYANSSYTLVGASGAGTGGGQEGRGQNAASVAGSINMLPLGGNLRRTGPNYDFEVEQTTNEPAMGPHPQEDNAGDKLIEVVHSPETKWPEDAAGDQGRRAAVSLIGTRSGLTDDPRSQYYARPYTDAAWIQTQKVINGLAPERLPPNVSEADFRWAQSELSMEIDWLQAMHAYVGTLAAPYREMSLQSWADLTSIASEINNNVKAGGDDKVFMVVAAIFDGVRGLATLIPEVGEAFEAVNTIYDAALDIAEVTHTSESEAGEFQTTAGKVGSDLADRLADAEKTLTGSFAKSIAADYGKLRTVATCSLGLETCPDADEWRLSDDEKTRIGEGMRATLRNSFYGSLLPAKYTLWRIPVLSNETNAKRWAGQGALGFGSFHPFDGVPDSAQFARPYCRDMGDHEREEWEVYSLGHRTGAGTWGEPWKMDLPGSGVTDPIFAPVDPRLFPDGPLGNDKETFYLRNFKDVQVMDHFPHGDSSMAWDPVGRRGDCSGN